MKKFIVVAVAIAVAILATPVAAAQKKTFRAVQTWRQGYVEGWALDRLNQKTIKLDKKTIAGSKLGIGITVYVIDTGVGQDDCHGHGTVVASMIADERYGAAPGVQIVSVRALDCSGYGTSQQVVDAVRWVKDNANPSTSVVNMSLGGSPDAPVDAAVAELAEIMPVVVAAGNSSTNACNVSPARVPAAITIAAYDHSNFRSLFSNHGPCVDFWVPGTAIDGIDRFGNRVQWSGTSMAAALASGVIAYVADRDNITTRQVVQKLREQAARPYLMDARLKGIAAVALWVRD